MDKKYGHAAYGCGICCGPRTAYMVFNPMFLPVGGSSGQQIDASNSCNGQIVNITGDFPTWWTDNTAIATANGSQINGIAIGSTNHDAQSINMYFGPRVDSGGQACPLDQEEPVAGTNVISLTCSPSSVTRGSSATCTVNNPPSGATFSNWQFKDSNNNTVSGSGTSSSWSGVVVTSGTVSVKVASGNNTSTPSATITVTARSGFAFTAVSPNSEPNNSSPSPTCTLSVPSPPVPNSNLGLSCLEMDYHENDTTVSDSGPNKGYHYVTSVSSSNQGTSTAYYYVISPDLTNTSSPFYLAQTGTYDAQTNPNGYISGSNLLADTTRHESGTVNAHYENYVVAQNNPANNLGVVAEAETGPPSQSTSDFQTQINTDLTSAATSIKNAMSVQPCGQLYTGYDATCTFQGYVNYNF